MSTPTPDKQDGGSSARQSRRSGRPEGWLAAIALALICLISLLNTIVRYFTDASFAFTEEFSIVLLVIMSFAGAAVAARQNQHIRIELIEHLLPRPLLPVLYIVQWAVAMLVTGIVVWYGYQNAHEAFEWESLSPGLGLPDWIYVSWLPLLALAIMWRLTQNLWERLRALLGGGA